jgi:ketosteroid isomerase-like protein
METRQGLNQIKAEILEAERQWAKAFLELDLVTIEKLIDDDYILIQHDGSLERKAQVLESLASQHRHWESASSDNHEVRVYGDVAVVIGHWQSRGHNHDQAFDYEAQYMAVWVKRHDGWRITADQSTPIPKSEKQL